MTQTSLVGALLKRALQADRIVHPVAQAFIAQTMFRFVGEAACFSVALFIVALILQRGWPFALGPEGSLMLVTALYDAIILLGVILLAPLARAVWRFSRAGLHPLRLPALAAYVECERLLKEGDRVVEEQLQSSRLLMLAGRAATALMGEQRDQQAWRAANLLVHSLKREMVRPILYLGALFLCVVAFRLYLISAAARVAQADLGLYEPAAYPLFWLADRIAGTDWLPVVTGPGWFSGG